MLKKRLIPVLLLEGNDLVKSRRFDDPVYIGDPLNAINIFNDKEVDELVLIDISATKNKSGINFELLEKVASECFMPLSYGGGIDNMDQVGSLFSIGVDKVIINSALNDHDFISELINKYGSQSIVASIDLHVDELDTYYVYSYLDKGIRSENIRQYVSQLEELGVGELFINNVDRDGCQRGYDLNLINRIEPYVSLPVTYCGGAGSLEDFKLLADNSSVTGLAAGSFFVFIGKYNAVLISYPSSEDQVYLLGVS